MSAAIQAATAEAVPACPFCGEEAVVRAGRRKLAGGVRQVWRCTSCFRRFSSDRKTAHRIHPAAILDALCMVCQGYSYEDVLFALRRKHRVQVTKGTVSKWIAEFRPPYLDVRGLNDGHRQIVRSHLFTHRGLNYDFKVHLPKLATCPHEGVRRYLLDLPGFIDHSLFEQPPLSCSTLKLARNDGLRHFSNTALNRIAAQAVSLAETNRRRHPAVEDYFLSSDRNTIATEVPVYFYDKTLGGTVTGHIDILQWNFGKLQILDFKPNARKEDPDKVITQLTLYARALGYRTGLPLRDMACAYFDERDMYGFSPLAVLDGGARSRNTSGAMSVSGPRRPDKWAAAPSGRRDR